MASRRDQLGRLRGLCREKDFEFELTPGGQRVRLRWLAIGGDAVINPATNRPTFSLKEAILYLKRVEDDVDQHGH